MEAPSYPRRFGPYMLLESVGRGGMSEIELARRAVDDGTWVRFLVIKRIHPQHAENEGFVRMFQDEARVTAELHHENIAQTFDFGKQGDDYFLAMEYVPGLDLRTVQRIRQEQGERLPLRLTLRVMADVLAGLEHAHGRADTFGRPMRIVHRDVNPRNVMLSVRGDVKLIDFGVAKSANRPESTVGHAMKGKFAYMAPEQVESKKDIDRRADLFAVGIVLHELISGRHPLGGLQEVQMLHRILGGRFPALDVPADHPAPDPLRAVVARSLQVDRDHRYPSAAAMREEVLAAAEPIGGPMSAAELAEFVRACDPEGIAATAGRLEGYRDLPHDMTGMHVPEAPSVKTIKLGPDPAPDPLADQSTIHLDGPTRVRADKAEKGAGGIPWSGLLAGIGAGIVAGAILIALAAVVVVFLVDR